MKNQPRTVSKIFAMAMFLLLCSCSQQTSLDKAEAEADAAADREMNQPQITAASPPIVALEESAARPPENKVKMSPAMPLMTTSSMAQGGRMEKMAMRGDIADHMMPVPQPQFNTESYNNLTENRFILTANDPLSTFSIDVDTGSYANIRRMLNQNMLPPPGAVRIEEMVNYFDYDYPADPDNDISVSTEVGPSPWRKEAKLVRIGIAAKDINPATLPPSNLIFLIDVSGSMGQDEKLPLLQQSMHLLVNSLRPNDRIGIVVYAGSDRIVLPSTSGTQKKAIHSAIDRLSSGGATHGSSGIKAAYELARENFIPDGNNRIILASDGDFNVGVTSRDELEKLVAKERESGVFMTVLGFGMGNYHDDTMEVLADKGNGNYAYIDSLLEAQKVLVREQAANLFTLASDVKLQLEFNPAKVGAYRLLGYENRQLADEDFKDDKKDAGEIGVGHRVTALYEILPPGSPELPQVDSLKYQKYVVSSSNDELLTVKIRFKPQKQTSSRELSHTVKDSDRRLSETSDDFRFAAAVAGFGMLLVDSDNRGDTSFEMIKDLAANSRGKDPNGYRGELVRLVESAMLLKSYTTTK